MSKWQSSLSTVCVLALFALIIALAINDSHKRHTALPLADDVTVAAVQLADGRGTVLRIVDLGGYRLAVAYNKVGGMGVVALEGKPEEP